MNRKAKGTRNETKETKMAERKIYFHTRYIGGGWLCTVLETIDDGSNNLRTLADLNFTCDLTIYEHGQHSLDRDPKQPFMNECLSHIVDAIKKQPGLVIHGEDTPF